MANDPVVLTADAATRWLRGIWTDEDYGAMREIEDKRTVVVPRISEAEAKAAFDKHYEEQAFLGLAYRRLTLDCWLAALRYAGVLK